MPWPERIEAMSSVSISWGLLEDESPIYIKDAQRGADCNARCPGCKAPLIARQGLRKEWHFAHHPGSTCSGESVVHALVKYFLRTVPEPFYLPSMEVKAELQDCIGERHTRSTWHYDRHYSLVNAEEEQSVAADLRPDCRATVKETGETLWIEVFFKNKKDDSDIKKMQDHNISCIEIDVSNLTFNSPQEEFIRAIFKRAPRQWLHHSEQANLKDRLLQELGSVVEAANQTYQEELLASRDHLSAIAEHVAKFFYWPVLSAGAGAGQIAKVPRVGSINPEWVQVESAWMTTGFTEEKAIECQVLLSLAPRGSPIPNLPIPADGLSKPTLLIELHALQHVKLPTSYRISWHHVARWQQAIENKVLKNLADRPKREIVWQQRFVALNAIDQQSAALQLIGIEESPELRTGSFSKAWNCYPVTWKCLVLNHHMLVGHYPTPLVVEGIAADRLITRILRLSGSPEALRSREIELYIWLKALNKDGLLVDNGRQVFTLRNAPRDIARFLRVPSTSN